MRRPRSNNNVVYVYPYHIVCGPKYRRKTPPPIDARRKTPPPIDARRKTISAEQSERCGQELIEVAVMPHHVHLLVGCEPQFGIPWLVKALKGFSSHSVCEEYPALKRRLPSLWTNPPLHRSGYLGVR
jgi:putative transposase